MSDHTPGPWTAKEPGDVGFINIEPTNIYIDSGAALTAEDRANARLVVAAPKLLKACQAICHAAKLNDPAMGAVAATLAAAAIAEAGEELELPLQPVLTNDPSQFEERSQPCTPHEAKEEFEGQQDNGAFG